MDKNIAILQNLYELTKNREKKWSHTNTNNVDQYSINVGKGKIVIEYNRLGDKGIVTSSTPNYEYRVTFYNNEDTVVDQLTMKFTDFTKPEHKLIANLWKEVEGSYLGKDETLDSMMQDLGLL